MKIIFIADAFAHQIIGGGELNNKEFIQICINNGHDVTRINSHLVTLDFLKKNKESGFIIGNYINLNESCKIFITENIKYIIYEHDHKYLKNRNPACYENFKAPRQDIINFDFYNNAVSVLCQTLFHKKIVQDNLNIDNITNLGGNLWPIQSLKKMVEISKKEKADQCSIIDSIIEHKNTQGAIRYAEKHDLKYERVSHAQYNVFLDILGRNEKLIFLPKTPETLCRVVVESRMMGMKVITNNLVGATREGWFSLKGPKLVGVMLKKREEIPNKILGFFQNAKQSF